MRHGRFSQADVTRAVRAVKAAGEIVSHVIVEHDGRIVVHCGKMIGECDRVNPLDRLLVTRRSSG